MEKIIVISGASQSGRSTELARRLGPASDSVIVDVTGSWLGGRNTPPCDVFDGRPRPGIGPRDVIMACHAMMWERPGMTLAIDDVEHLGDCRRELNSLMSAAHATGSRLILAMPSYAMEQGAGARRIARPENREPNRLPVGVLRITTRRTWADTARP